MHVSGSAPSPLPLTPVVRSTLLRKSLGFSHHLGLTVELGEIQTVQMLVAQLLEVLGGFRVGGQIDEIEECLFGSGEVGFLVVGEEGRR